MKSSRPRGRPKKDSMDPWKFDRLAEVTCAYDEFREKGGKHSVAVRDVANKLRISETEVKRILSTHRPRGRETILRFERSPRNEEDKKKYSLIYELSAELEGKKGISLPQLPVYDETHQREKFLIRFSARPEYPRHNTKAS